MDIKEEDILGDRIHDHWYYVAKGRALIRYLEGVPPGPILDVGAGSGFFSRLLLDNGWTEATCVDPFYAAERTETHGGKPVRFRQAVSRSDAGLVLMMDVCEHVDDDVALIRAYADKVAPGTRFLITVPAFQFLFSAHDLFLEHRRRYTRPQLVGRVEAAGLVVVKSAYFFAAVLPLAATLRLVEKALLRQGRIEPRSSLKVHSPAVNGILKAACAAEVPFFPLNRLAGLTVFCLARRP